MSTVIYLIRHAQVENPNNVNYGRLAGFGLSEEGKKQAEKLRAIFKSLNISQIYTSPLLRSVQTSEIIAAGKIPTRVIKKITEVNFGKLEGKPLEETLSLRQDPKNHSKFPKESYQKVQKRMVGFIKKCIKKHPGESILLVSHADPIITARFYFENRTLNGIEETETVNGSATILTFDDKLQCIKIEYKNLTGAKRDF